MIGEYEWQDVLYTEPLRRYTETVNKDLTNSCSRSTGMVYWKYSIFIIYFTTVQSYTKQTNKKPVELV